MKRNLKTVGAALAAVLAMGAVAAAGAAQAAAPEFHCTSISANCVVTGSSNLATFSINGGVVKCTETEGLAAARYKSTIPKTGSESTVITEYGNTATEKGCKVFGLKMVVHMNGCDRVFKSVPGSNPPTSTVTINCPAGSKTEFTVPSAPCVITVGPQGPLSHIVFENEGGTEPTGVMAHVTLSEIHYGTEGAGCPHPGATETDGIYTDEVTLKAFEDIGSAGEYTEGTQVGLHVF